MIVLVGDAPMHAVDETPTMSTVRPFTRDRNSVVNVIFTGSYAGGWYVVVFFIQHAFEQFAAVAIWRRMPDIHLVVDMLFFIHQLNYSVPLQ